MNKGCFFSSVTRISPLKESPFQIGAIPRDRWQGGDYIVSEVIDASSPYLLELSNGRMIPVSTGDRIVGALGVRAATLEATGHWNEVGDDGLMTLLTGAGLCGKLLSRSPSLGNLIGIKYLGHVHVHGDPVAMGDFVMKVPHRTYKTPTIVIIGTSMSAGKTTTATLLVRRLKLMGLRVTGAKLAGAARYRDTLWLSDAGADHCLDFVEVGLPSTICSEKKYCDAIDQLLSRIEANESDVAVIELGASPLEPYNGSIAIEAIKNQIKTTVLCASDPYAVVGIMAAYGEVLPDLVTGPATNTLAGLELIEQLTGIPSLNLLEPASLPQLDALLAKHFPIDPHAP